MDSLTKAATPKYTELIESVDKQTEVLENILLEKKLQARNDAERDERWIRQKAKGSKLSVVQLCIGFTALYLGILQVDASNPYVQKFFAFVNYISELIT